METIENAPGTKAREADKTQLILRIELHIISSILIGYMIFLMYAQKKFRDLNRNYKPM